MIIGITGHANIEKVFQLPIERQGNIYNKTAFDAVYIDIYNFLQNFVKTQGITLQDLTLVSGMSRGVDEVFAFIAIHNNLPLILSIPGSIQWHKNRPPSRGIRAQAIWYDEILSYSNIQKIYEVKKKNFQFVNFARNQHMVNVSDKIISYKRYESAGTNDCIQRAVKQNKYAGNV